MQTEKIRRKCEKLSLLQYSFSYKSKIWDDPNRYMKSMYNESFIKPESLGERHTKNDIQKQLIQLRSSNILMGTQGQDYNSMFMEDYVLSLDSV